MFPSHNRSDTSQMDALVSSIVSDKSTQDLLHSYGLNASHITWEDTGRSKGSCWGPNITDLTMLVKQDRRLMPVIRKPNFGDLTHDVPIEAFRLCVGNESSVPSEGRVVSLKDYLSNLQAYCPDVTTPTSLLDARDSVILTSTQCCVLPVKKGSKTEFALQLFNYQSWDQDPAVLVILVTKDGTSAQVLGKSNQTLFFNASGKGHWLSAERLEDSRERRGVQKTRVDSFKEMKSEEKLENTILMIQVPLVTTSRPRGEFCMSNYLEKAGAAYDGSEDECGVYLSSEDAKPAKLKCCAAAVPRSRGMDMGQVGIGSEDGPFIGTKGLKLVRDTRFPIRCTYQYYRVTDENSISEKNIADIAEQLNQVVQASVATGSLVLNPESGRKTEPVLKPAPYKSINASAVWEGKTMSDF
jgi:hypothetical protein